MNTRVTLNRRPHRALAVSCGLALVLLAMGVPRTLPAQNNPPTDVKVERVKPNKEKHPTLKFLKENRAFIRARFDLLREKQIAGRGEAVEIDPRYLAYQRMLNEILAAKDSASSAADARKRRALLESITELGDLEAQLDLMDRLLAGQRDRLEVLQADFAGRQATALMVVVSGFPDAIALDEIELRVADGTTLRVALSAGQRTALRNGGVVEVFYGFVEPREQVIEVALAGDGWPSSDTGYVTLEPTRDRLTFLQLDLSALQPAEGASSIHATTWLHDARTRFGDG